MLLARAVTEYSQQTWVQRGSSLTSVREMGALRSTPGTSGKSVGDREDLPPGLLQGRPARALQIQDAILHPWWVAGRLSQPGSASERLGLQGRVSSGARSVPWAHRVRSWTRSGPWTPRVRSVPWAPRVRFRVGSVPEAHRVGSCPAYPTLAPVAASVSRPSSSPLR